MFSGINPDEFFMGFAGGAFTVACVVIIAKSVVHLARTQGGD